MAVAGQPPATTRFLFITGSDDNDGVPRADGRNPIVGNTDVYKLLGIDKPFPRIQLTANFFRNSEMPDLLPYRCLFNLISDPDQNPKVLDNLRKLVRGFPGRIVNRPEDVLASTRDQVARQLAGVPGLVAPKVVRLRSAKRQIVAEAIARAGLRFPLILRQAGTHTGRIIGLFDTIEDLQAALPDKGELIATEFVDFRSADGLYRKYRIFVFGRRIVFRHMLVSDEWNVHARDRRRFMLGRPDLREEEHRISGRPDQVFTAAVQEALKAVRRRIALNYFGMDFGIAADDSVVLFEANATMNFFPFMAEPEFDYVRLCLPPAQRAIREMVPNLSRALLAPAA